MGAAVLFPPNTVFTDEDFVPLAGGKLYTYQAGTSTPQDTYAQSDLDPGSANSNPVILNASGFSDTPLFCEAAAYKVNLTDANDVQIPGWPMDDYSVAEPDF